MKKIIPAFFLIIIIINLVIIFFTVRQAKQEEERLSTDLRHRSTMLADSLTDNIEPYMITNSNTYLQQVVEKFANRERLIGLAIYDNKDNTIALSEDLPKELSASQTIAAASMDADKITDNFLRFKEKKLYLFAVPLRDEEKSIIGSLLIVQSANYIDTSISEIWKNNMLQSAVYSMLISVALLIILRWIIYQPIRALVKSIQDARLGKVDKANFSKNFFFQPLINEVFHISKSLQEARTSASQEARMRQEQADSAWTGERLKEFTKETLEGRKIFLVSNREPYVHTKQNGKITYIQPASGMVTALEPIMRACEGMWIAHGGGNADKLTADENSRIRVPPDDPKYTLRRVWLSEEEEKGYYYGFANEGLWPLCHTAHTRPIFRKEDWLQYQRVNGKFAQVILNEVRNISKPIILIQDYHFAILPRMIKNSRPDALIGIFWHIPWPNAESFRICPWKKELLDGMLGADLLGFHTQLHCNNFIDSVSHDLEALIDLEQFAVQRNEHLSFVKPFPVSIPFLEGKLDENTKETNKYSREKISKKLGVNSKYIGVGIDRLDYTKGILERFRAVEYFLQTHPSFKEQFTFIQIAAPTRSSIPHYSQFAQSVEKEAERINTIFKTRNWKPIILLKKHHTHEEIDEFYKAADLCLVTSLHDGMNLVAKEFIMSRADEKGVLILSQFTGASKELKEALIVNPYSTEQTAEAIETAIGMPEFEQAKRMKKMRDRVKKYNVYRWSAEFLRTMVGLET